MVRNFICTKNVTANTIKSQSKTAPTRNAINQLRHRTRAATSEQEDRMQNEKIAREQPQIAKPLECVPSLPSSFFPLLPAKSGLMPCLLQGSRVADALKKRCTKPVGGGPVSRNSIALPFNSASHLTYAPLYDMQCLPSRALRLRREKASHYLEGVLCGSLKSAWC